MADVQRAPHQNIDPTAPAFRGPDFSIHVPIRDVVNPSVTAAVLLFFMLK
jgi:hypothetical protein